MRGSFAEDVAFLKKHTDAVVLRRGRAALVVVPQYQGRVMTSTASGDSGASSGWINDKLVEKSVQPKEAAKGTLEEHLHAFGGEERFWLGPEGGQYAIFFEPGTEFTFANWFTPPAIDTEGWQVMERSETGITLSHRFHLVNHSGTRFDVEARRTVRLLTPDEIEGRTGIALPNTVDVVAYESMNRVVNRGGEPWAPEKGLLSIWMLSMFRPSGTTTAFLPFTKGSESVLGPIVNADYFGTVPPSRLKVGDGVVYFKCDGNARGKIGLSPQRSTGIAGSYDPVAGRLTLMVSPPPDADAPYVNSMWETQAEPYRGDALNSYNDGPVDDSGEQMGPFYELESSSPALALQPGGEAAFSQMILHAYGSGELLQPLADAVAGVDLNSVRTAF